MKQLTRKDKQEIFRLKHGAATNGDGKGDNKVNNEEITKLKEKLMDKDAEIKNILQQCNATVAAWQNESHRLAVEFNEMKMKFDALTYDINDFFGNWGVSDYGEMMQKMNQMQRNWNIIFQFRDDMLIGHLTAWSEKTMMRIHKNLLNGGAAHGGLKHMIDKMERVGLFATNCPVSYNRRRCNGHCNVVGCGAYQKELMYVWKQQRNERVHSKRPEALKTPEEIQQMIQIINSMVSNWEDARKSVVGHNKYVNF